MGALLLSNALMAQHFFDICEDKLDTERYMDPPTNDYNFNINANYFNTTVDVNSYNGEYQIFANKRAQRLGAKSRAAIRFSKGRSQ